MIRQYLRNLKKLTVLNVSHNALSELPTSAIKDDGIIESTNSQQQQSDSGYYS